MRNVRTATFAVDIVLPLKRELTLIYIFTVYTKRYILNPLPEKGHTLIPPFPLSTGFHAKWIIKADGQEVMHGMARLP